MGILLRPAFSVATLIQLPPLIFMNSLDHYRAICIVFFNFTSTVCVFLYNPFYLGICVCITTA